MIPAEAGAQWPGRDWESPGLDLELAPKRLHTAGPSVGPKANKKHEVDFLEMFAGCAILTGACSTAGLKVASALDILYHSYGRAWDFSRPEHQADAAYLIAYVFRPKAIHLGIQCADFSIMGNRNPSAETTACVLFAGRCAAHQQRWKLGASVESPWKSDLWSDQTLMKYMDYRYQGSAWTRTRSAGCQFGMVFPGHEPVDVQDGDEKKTFDAYGSCIEKGRGWVSNFPH